MDQFLSVLKFIGIILEVVLIFNLLIIVHELGHFLAARWRGLVIEGFGIWFGKPIWKKKINGVTYSFGSIPFGGFVKLPQLMDTNLEGQSEFAGQELPKLKPVDKIIVAAAGPVFSLLLAFVFALLVWVLGRPVGEAEGTTVVGTVLKDSPAAQAGLKAGDKILKVDGHPVKRFGGQSDDSITWRIVRSEGKTVPIEYERAGKVESTSVTPKIPEGKWYQRKGLRTIGVSPKSTPMVARVERGGNGEKAGLRENDLITGVNGIPILDDEGIDEFVRANPSTPLILDVKRGNELLHLPYELRGPEILEVFDGSPAATAGLKPGDRIVQMDEKRMRTTQDLIEYVQAHDEKTITLHVDRPLPRADKKAPLQFERMKLTVKPEVPIEVESGEKKPSIGVRPGPGLDIVFDMMGPRTVVYPGPFEQILLGVNQIANTIGAVASKSDIGVQHMGGPVMMMRVYYMLFESPYGWQLALWFSVIINVNLALLNMLPIPPLDGSHITLGIVELIRGKPVKGKALEYIVGPFTLLVIGFMLFVTFFDVQDLFGGGGAKKQPMRFKPPAPAVQPAS
jgi:regulator of sigma E protease